MGENLAHKILRKHLVSGRMEPGQEIGVRIDQTLTQDATGTMAFLQFESMKVPRVRTELSVSYVDHNTLQTGFENADDHCYLQSAAHKYGVRFSRAGNGICHQVHLERFSRPGRTLLGSDSHTPTCGAMGMIAMGAGGLDVAVAMAGGPFFLQMPEVIGVKLTGRLRPWVTPKDVILEMLRRLSVKGGVGKIVEYCGPGVASLDLPGRATITNMGAELGATTSIFPTDDATRAFLAAQGRAGDFARLAADADAEYDERVGIDLATIEPLLACPHSPGNVKPVREVAGEAVSQVCIGSCTNSSYRDLMTVAAILKGKRVHPSVSLTVSPGSRQVLQMIAASGGLEHLVAAGARILESACGPCIGMGQAPGSGAVTVRSFNRNFEGRSGTADARVFLASPETCAACALAGKIADPRDLGKAPAVKVPKKFPVDDGGIVPPERNARKAAAEKTALGPNIQPVPVAEPLAASLKGRVTLVVGDDITTDHIMPAGSWLKYRSNVPKYSQAVFHPVDPKFPERAAETKARGEAVVVVGGANYGQGSSREHAAMVPMYLGLRCVLAASFARIHRDNLVNFGILPLAFRDPADAKAFSSGDAVELPDVLREIQTGDAVTAVNRTNGRTVACRHGLSERQIRILVAGGLLNWAREAGGK